MIPGSKNLGEDVSKVKGRVSKLEKCMHKTTNRLYPSLSNQHPKFQANEVRLPILFSSTEQQ